MKNKLTLLAFLLSGFNIAAAPDPSDRLHAHNDYLHARPLLDALEQGFCSVEADIYLAEGRLQVAHNRPRSLPERSIQMLYLEPLRQRVQQNNGRVFKGGPEFTLLVDFKEDWKLIYPVFRRVLEEYSEILTSFSGNKTHTNGVRIIISGNRSPMMFEGELVRYAALDGELTDLESGKPAALIPWISSNWYRTFKWRGVNEFPEKERSELRRIVNRAHAQGCRVRFWGGPDQPLFWKELLAVGVDLLNTDRLEEAARFVASGDRPAVKTE